VLSHSLGSLGAGRGPSGSGAGPSIAALRQTTLITAIRGDTDRAWNWTLRMTVVTRDVSRISEVRNVTLKSEAELSWFAMPSSQAAQAKLDGPSAMQ
jgi:hypothetical protein